MRSAVNFVTLAIVSVVIALAPGCEKLDAPKDIIEHDTFVDIYIQLLDSTAFKQAGDLADTSISPLAQRVLERHEVTLAKFKSTVAYYNTSSERWAQFYTDVTERIKARTPEREPEQ